MTLLSGFAGGTPRNGASMTRRQTSTVALSPKSFAASRIVYAVLINPGPLLFIEHTDFVWGLIASMYLGNVVGLVLVLTTVPIFASILRVPFAAVAPMIVVSCAIGAYAIQNAMFDIWLMLGFGVVGYVFKKIRIPLAPFTLALVLGNRAEDAFRLSMIGSGGDMKVFWSNGLVGSITTLAILLLFWPVIDKAFASLGRLMRPAHTSG